MKDTEFIITEIVSVLRAHNTVRTRRFADRVSSAFIVTLSGKIRFSFDGGEVVSDPGHAVLLPEGLTYNNECLEEADSIVFNFHAMGALVPQSIAFSDHAFAMKHYNSILALTPFPSYYSSCAMLESIYALARSIFSTRDKDTQLHPMVREAIIYMQKRLESRELSVRDVAHNLNISEIYLRKLFSAHLSTTPFKKLTELRMNRARLLIADGRGLKEVCENVGYADIFQFSRAYKRHFGHPPSSDR